MHKDKRCFMRFTCKQSNVGVFGVIGASGHTTDGVPDHLQRVSLLYTHMITLVNSPKATEKNPQQHHEHRRQRRMAIKKHCSKSKLMIHWWKLGAAAPTREALSQA